MIKIDKETSKKIVEESLHAVKSYNLNGRNFYIKRDDMHKELIGYNLASYLGLVALPYSYLSIENLHFAVSRDLKENFFVEAYEILHEHKVSLISIIEALEIKQILTERIKLDLYKMYVFDILFLNDDRNCSNWGITKENGEYCIIIYDNTDTFSVFNPPFIGYNDKNYNGGKGRIFVNIYADFTEFLDNLPADYFDIIAKMIDDANPSNIKSILEGIEKKNNIKIDPKFMDIYKSHYEEVLKILNKKKGVTNAR